jgi:hypothetical protein
MFVSLGFNRKPYACSRRQVLVFQCAGVRAGGHSVQEQHAGRQQASITASAEQWSRQVIF